MPVKELTAGEGERKQAKREVSFSHVLFHRFPTDGMTQTRSGLKVNLPLQIRQKSLTEMPSILGF